MTRFPPAKFPPATGFELTVVGLDQVRAMIGAVGDLDLAAREALHELLQHQEDAGRLVVELDVSEVTFLDCSCLGVLVGAHHRLLERHGLLVLTGIGACIARTLQLTGLTDTLLQVAPDSILSARSS